MTCTSEDVARELLEVAPSVVAEIRQEKRRRRSPDLTVPQFRTLAFIDRHGGASLSAVADHMGLTLPSTSRLVDVLSDRSYITREDNLSDRRRVKLNVTSHGLTMLEASRQGTLNYLANRLSTVKPQERQVIVESMKILRTIFMREAATGVQ